MAISEELLQRLRKSRAFIFDLDGTLIDSVEAHVTSWVASFNYVGYSGVTRDDVRKLIGLSGRDIVRTLLGDSGLRKYSLIRRLKNKVFFLEIKEGNVDLYPCVLELLTYLRTTDTLLGLASSTPNYLLIQILEIFDIMDYFDAIVGGNEVESGKPNPDIFVKAFSKLGVSPREGAVVGDTYYDVIPANRIGAFSVLVLHGNTASHNIARAINEALPKLKVRSLCELLDILKS
ncbi:MAG: HAD family hydrolase [Desulfurococcales archaeon]|nr:HAD family hydrolase [Desulfurococcales archaeon]